MLMGKKDSAARAVVGACRAGDDVKGAVRKVLGLAGGIPPGTGSVLIKPNAVFAIRPSSGVVTNPVVLDGLMECLMSAGIAPERITIGESGSMGFDTQKAFRKIGILEICERYGAKALDFHGSDHVAKTFEIEGRRIQLDIAKAVFDADLVINVPVIKTHFQTGASMALKNMFGAVGFESRKLVHKFCLDEGLAYLNKALPRYMTVGDGTVGLEGFGPSILGKPGGFGLLFSGMDPVAHDATVCRLFGIDVPAHVRAAADIGIGISDPGRIDIAGESADGMRRRIKPAEGNFSPLKNVAAIDGDACAYCLYAVYLVLQRLSTQKVNTDKEIEVLFGRNIDESACDPKKEKMLCGDCTERFRKRYGNFLPGCPPRKSDIISLVRKLLEAQDDGR